ncbi:sialate O-acetylesterase [bacterium]|nr:sialate O-acetylesterase [bacterium]
MKIISGLFDGMVLQRTKRGFCDVVIEGNTTGRGRVIARVTAGRKPVRGLAGARIGRASRGKVTARLKGIPAGGPYTVALHVRDAAGATSDSLIVRNVYVGDVWILAGQSNMQGCGLLAERLTARRQVRALYMDDHWAAAEEPLHQLYIAVDAVHDAQNMQPPPNGPVTGVGPGVAFGQALQSATGVPQGLLACAHGGTSMAQWDPKLKKLGGGSLYGAMLRRFRRNGGRVAGVLWYQGESDASPDAAKVYTARMTELIRAMRRDFGDARLPVAIVQISRLVSRAWVEEKSWNSVQDQERRLPEKIRNLTVVPTVDLELNDLIHLASRGQHELGRRLAQAMRVLREGRRAGNPPIALKSIRVEKDTTGRLMDKLVVEFANVTGRLVSPVRAMGFALGEPDVHDCIYRVDLVGNRAILHTGVQEADLAQMQLFYGHGVNPACNIRDEAGRSLPVFGPVPVGKPRAMTPFLREFLVSGFMPAAAKLEGLAYTPPAELNLEPRVFPDRLAARNLEIINTKGRVGVYYYATRFTCAEPMKLQLVLGYDGPTKVWLNGREVQWDPEGTNPSGTADDFVPFEATAGEHEMLVAFGNNNGNAWGIHLRLERVDLPERLIRKGTDAYRLPVFGKMGGGASGA